MKVGYVLRYYPALSETFVAAEIEGLRRRGVEVEVAALGERRGGPVVPQGEVPVFRAPRGLRRLAGGWRLADRRLTRWQRPKDLSRLPWLRRLARERGWDRVHVHFAGEALEVAVLAATGLPVSVTVHGSDLFRPRASLASLLPQVSVLTVCEHHRRWIAAHYGVQATVVRCGVDPQRFGRARPGGEGLPVVCVARDVPKKNLDGLVAAMPSGSALRLVSDAVRLAGPSVRVGLLVPSAVPALLAASQLFVLPCRVAPDGDRDGVPVALMEAMASGLPVISTAVSGIPELVDDAVGWLVPPEDPVALRHALLQALGSPEERVRRGAAGRARIAEGWTLDGQVEGLLDALRR